MPHHYHSHHCPYCCPSCHPGYYYAPHHPYWGRRPGTDYEKEAIKERIEILKDELKAMEERLSELERPR